MNIRTVFFVLALSLTVTARAEKPVVVLVGDSIRMGYAPIVVEQLKDVAEVVSSPENGGDSANVLKHLDEWVISKRPAVVHFNAGLHDLKTDRKTGAKQVGIDDYRTNLAEIVRRLERESKARLVFATTTPIVDERHKARKGDFDRIEADVLDYNRAARDALARTPVAIDDLHELVVDLNPRRMLGADGTHFTAEANRVLAAQVARAVRDAFEGPAATREAVCRRADVAPIIDGKLDDPAWKTAAVIDKFPAFWRNQESGNDMQARFLWDDDACYFMGKMTDHEVRAFGEKRNDMLWLGDVFELFLKPDESKPAYYEFQVNPKSVLLELPFARRGEEFAKVAALPTLGFQAVATVDGTLDKPGDRDRGWTVEGRIPWSAFARGGGRPEPGTAWRFAICRYDYGPEGTQPVLVSSAPLRRPSFHQYEDYGLLRFEGSSK